MSGSVLILASGSPRRRELLQRVGVRFEVQPAEIDEAVLSGERAEQAAQRLAKSKAQTVAVRNPGRLVLAADTIVALRENGSDILLNKPQDGAHAAGMLRALSGREHLVCTAFCLVGGDPARNVERVVTTKVLFKSLSEADIAAYVQSGEPLDKAGGYGIQGKGVFLVRDVAGSYTNVIGLPLREVLDELEAAGVWSPRLLNS